MPEAALIALLIVFPLIGLVVRRAGTVVLPLIGWPVLYVGLKEGWWGHGTGDGWQYAAASLTAIGTATTAAAVALGRYIAGRTGPHKQRTLARSR